MNLLFATNPRDVLWQIRGKLVIEAGVATGSCYMVFASNVFDPPIELEKGLDWIDQALPMPTFKAASAPMAMAPAAILQVLAR